MVLTLTGFWLSTKRVAGGRFLLESRRMTEPLRGARLCRQRCLYGIVSRYYYGKITEMTYAVLNLEM